MLRNFSILLFIFAFSFYAAAFA